LSEKNSSTPVLRLSQIMASSPKTICSDALLGRDKLIFIVHDGHRYQLRITKLRKLILTK
jgi:hemin uptake protein HemP